ncbi:hypothetical protein V6N12_056208 [Hibiscus sabdariffa]|uniref:RNase H type-1 domain-containing protein n=1 Tax=Hibiscus sabdariffa TaxID=183260 RepID=A0ABR2CRT8_9ROSI
MDCMGDLEGSKCMDLQTLSCPSHTSSWVPPPPNFLKINCDVSFSNSRKYVGIAAVVRNSNRIVVDGINAQVHASGAHVAECLALRLEVKYLQILNDRVISLISSPKTLHSEDLGCHCCWV